MTNFSVPIGVADQASEPNQTDSALPVIVCLATICLVLITIVIFWIAIIDDPGGGQPRISVEIQPDASRLVLGPVGVASVRPSITPDPNDVSVDIRQSPGSGSQNVSSPAPALPAAEEKIAGTGNDSAADSDLAFGTEPTVNETLPAASHPDTQRLSVFPLNNMVTRSEFGLIPKRASNGQTPFSTYSRPQTFIPDGPRIAIVVGSVGLSQSATADAVSRLPPTMALAYSAYGENLESWKKLSRESGFELLAEVPMEPFNYPQNDPGPHTLLVEGTASENKARLDWVLSRISNYIGVIPAMGARFTSNEAALKPLVSELHKMGLAFIDPSISVRSVASQVVPGVSTDRLGHLPFLKVDVVLDSNVARAAMEQSLIRLEELAETNGLAVGYTRLRPATVETLAQWSRLLEQRGITLIPLSAAISLSVPEP